MPPGAGPRFITRARIFPGTRVIVVGVLLLIVLLNQGCATNAVNLFRGITNKRSLTKKDIESPDTYILTVPFIKQQSENCCGQAALAMVLLYWTDRPETVGFLKQHECPKEGFSGKQMVDMAVSQGFKAMVYQGSLADLVKHISATRPIIVIIDNIGALHYVVVTGFSKKGEFIINDPLSGRKVYKQDFFVDLWARAGYFALMAVPRDR